METDTGDGADSHSPRARRSVSGLVGALERATRGALSANTRRALRSDLGIFAEWCAERGREALPAYAATLAAFIDTMAAVRPPAIRWDSPRCASR